MRQQNLSKNNIATNEESLSEFITVQESARVLSVSERAVRQMIARLEIPYYRVGVRRIRIRTTDLIAFLSRHRVEAVNAKVAAEEGVR